MWWLWPHFKRIWAMAATVIAGLTINYLYGLMGNQSVPNLERVSRFLLGYWPLAGGVLVLFATVSVIAERAHRRHAAPHFIGEVRGRRGAKLPPLPASATAAATLIVGRDDELKQLREWFASVLQGERRVVFVSGEAGIGKTTFVNTFIDSLRREGVRIARGQCVEQYGAGEPYMPMLEALTQLGRGPEGPHLLAILHRLAPAWLAQLLALLTAAERARIQGEAQGLTQQRMLREMAETLAALAADAPLVILLEDLHWSDASTLDLIAAIARRTEPARLLILGTYRPVEMLAGDHPLRALKQELELHQQCEELRLKLLSEDEVAVYLNRRFANDGSQYSGLAPAIYQRSEGNPLFMVNVVDYLKAQGPQFDTSKIETPRNIRQMIERNLERLGVDERRVLQAASVAGAEFSAASIAAAVEQPIAEIEECCDGLARKEQFIGSQGRNAWPDGTRATGYRFLHALYQEVLYQRTSAGQQDDLHRRIAEREEVAWGAGAAEIAVELAYHYERCGDKPKALKYLELAGERAVERRAYHEAEQHYRDAIAALQTLPESSERDVRELKLQVAFGGVMQWTRGWSAVETVEVYTRARVVAERSGGADSINILAELCTGATLRGEQRAALALADQMLEIARRGGSTLAFITAQRAQAFPRHILGDLIGARQLYSKVMEYYRGEDFSDKALPEGVSARIFAGHTEWFLGYPDRAVRLVEEALSIARRQNNPFATAFALSVGGYVHALCRDYRRSLEDGDEAVRLAIASGLPHSNAIGKNRSAWARAQVGDTGGAADQIRAAIAELNGMKFYAHRSTILAGLAETQAVTGAYDEALVTVEQAIQTNPDELFFRPELLRLRGELRLQSTSGKAHFELAEQDFRESIDLAQQMSAKSLELRATTSLARLLASQDRRDEARTMLAEIYNWFTEGFDTADLKEAKALLDELRINGGAR